MTMRHPLLAALACSAALTLPLGAQSAPVPAQRMCDMSFRVLMVRVVDSAGAPVPDARITVQRVRTRQRVAQAEAMSAGDYKVLEDGALRDLRAAGEPFDVTLVKGARTRRVRVQVGMDEGRCHVRFIRVPDTIVL